MRTFKSTYSTVMLVATGVLIAIIAYGTYSIINLINHKEITLDSTELLILYFALLLIVATTGYSYLSQMNYIVLTDKELIIKKMFGQVTILRDDIIHAAHKPNIRTDIRLYGASGFFGYRGLFWNRNSGKYHAYVKNGNCMVEIKTNRKTYVISCDEPHDLLHSIKR